MKRKRPVSMRTPTPLVAGIASAISARIHQGALPSGRALPSERDLAQEFAVSRLVIRAAIAELERRGLVERRDRCRPVVCATSVPAETVLNGHRSVAIWLWPNSAEFGASQILKGIQSVQANPNLRLTIASAVGSDWDGYVASEARFLSQVAADPHFVGGILWYLGGSANLGLLKEVREAGKALVLVDRVPNVDLGFDYVGTDNRSSAEEAVRHLLDLGHRRIACLTNRDPASSVKERLEGYRSALASAGVPYRPELVFPVMRDEDCGVEAGIDALLALPDPPTAIFGINDLIALQAFEILGRRGIAVPKHVSVVGFDGLLRWVPGGGHLTTAMQNFERIGQLAMEILIERIEQGPSMYSRHVLLEAPLALLGSTGPAHSFSSPPKEGNQPSEVIP